MTDRRDPTLGELPVVADAGATATHAQRLDPPRPSAGKRAGGSWPLVTAIALVLAALTFALYHWRAGLGARLVPPPQQNGLMQQADAALRAGRLTSPDGRGARELYQAMLARDPDDLAAREALVRVGNAALAQAQAAVNAHHLDLARQNLDLARDLAVPVVELQPVEEALRHDTGSEPQIAALLEKADAAARVGHFDDGDTSAIAIYQQALAAAPDNAVVLSRRKDVLARMLGGIDALLAANDVAGAQRVVDRVASIDPGDLDLPAAHARLAEAVEQQQQARSRQLDGADADLRGGNTDAAVAIYRQVLMEDAGNLRAHEGLRSAGEALVRAANVAAANLDFPGAESALAKAHALSPELPSLRGAEKHLLQARALRAGIGPPEATAGEKAKIDDLLAAADHAIVRDQLLEPPGDSAFDKLHAASAIAPGDPRVVAASHRFMASMIACFQHEMIDNRLARAAACLDALNAVQPNYTSLPSMRTTLANRWIAYADERIGAGELDTAQHAIESARTLTPDDPAIVAMQERLRQARAGGRR